VSRVHCAGPRSSSADSSPAASRASRPGGSERARAMMADRCASVIRRLRPAPGRSPSPSTPSSLNRCSQRRTFLRWQPSCPAIARTPSPSQLSAMIRARSIQSAGACRAPASPRIFLASPSSCGARALKNFGTELASSQSADLPVPQFNYSKGNLALAGPCLAAPGRRRGAWRRLLGVGNLEVAPGEFLDVDVLERHDLDVLHEPGGPVHVPHPGVLHGDLEEHITVL